VLGSKRPARITDRAPNGFPKGGNLIEHAIVVRDGDPPRGDEIDAICAQVIAELSGELAESAELLCFSCGTNFSSVNEFAAAVIRPHARKGGLFGAACEACAKAGTNDMLICTFEAECRARC